MHLSRCAIILLLGASSAALAGSAPPAPAQPAAPKYGSWGVDYATMDRDIKPGDDFFGYAEGSWLKNAPIPSDKSRAGYNYQLPDLAENDVHALIEAAAKRADASASMRQVGDFYAAWMDEATIEAHGLAPAQPYLARIAAVSSTTGLAHLMAETGYAAPIGIGISADDADPTRYTVTAGQARLGLPSRDYYLLPGEKYVGIRKSYRDYIVKIQ